jgi:hypothetical protein
MIGTQAALETPFESGKPTRQGNFLLIDNEDYCDSLDQLNEQIFDESTEEARVTPYRMKPLQL